MLFLVTLLFGLYPSVESLSSMVITYGEPTVYNSSRTVATDSWQDCVRYCYELDSCVLAYSPVSPLNCQIYLTKEIWAVQKLDSSQGQLVAFKIDNADQTCPIGDNAPTYNNQTATAAYSDTLICDSDWESFTRPLTDWCIKLFGGPSVNYTQTDAVALCDDNSAVLTGLETQDERMYVANTALSMLGADYSQWSCFWVSGMRKTECTANDWPSISYCNSTIEQFTYSDAYLTNYAGYTWNYNTPDRNASGTWQNCIFMWIRSAATVTVNYQNGETDDALCNKAIFTDFAVRGVACGKLPDVPRTNSPS